MPIAQNKTSIILYLNKELKAQLKELAEKDQRSLNSYITLVLSNHIKENTIQSS